VIVDAARRADAEAEQWQDRVLNDGSRHRVYKRFFAGEELADELAGGQVLHEGRWFVVVADTEHRGPRGCRTWQDATGMGARASSRPC
jgi:hypothetical protein